MKLLQRTIQFIVWTSIVVISMMLAEWIGRILWSISHG